MDLFLIFFPRAITPGTPMIQEFIHIRFTSILQVINKYQDKFPIFQVF
jgi:hypothetical protein